MTVFRDMQIKWKGKEYTVAPTLRLLRLIETNGVSIADVVHRSNIGQAPVSHVALILSILLRTAGADDATEEAVYSEIMTGVDEEQVHAYLAAVLYAFTPQIEEPAKNFDAPKRSKRKSKSA